MNEKLYTYNNIIISILSVNIIKEKLRNTLLISLILFNDYEL